MHMTATNLCVWLNLIVQETKHEIMHFSKHHEEGDTHSEHHPSGIDIRTECPTVLLALSQKRDLNSNCQQEKENITRPMRFSNY